MFSKEDRFYLTGPFDDKMPNYYLIIIDFDWWVNNEEEVYDWMSENTEGGTDCHRGLVVSLKSKRDLTNFLLKWQAFNITK